MMFDDKLKKYYYVPLLIIAMSKSYIFYISYIFLSW